MGQWKSKAREFHGLNAPRLHLSAAFAKSALMGCEFGVEDQSDDSQTSAYDALLLRAYSEALNGVTAHIPIQRQELLNGVPYKAFRQSIPIEVRREEGTFFSGAELAAELARMLLSAVPANARVLDPTCGMGDLLLAYAAELPLGSTLDETLASWGHQLAGIDPREDLVAMAKARLVALARSRGGFKKPLGAMDTLFPHIIVGDMFAEADILAAADGILFNPPFGCTTEHEVSTWATGKLSSAALFLDGLIAAVPNSAPIAAVLPEVLRCGSRYALFREHLAERGWSGAFISRGRFDAWTDVDVFTTLLLAAPGPLWEDEAAQGENVGDRFTVRVGAVVPHRHEKKGPWRRFICAKSVPAWSQGYAPASSRRFKGTVFQPPFVVVRRTSSPSDRKRAVGAIIVGDEPVAVENHLIVLAPNKGGYKSCFDLMKVLEDDRTSDYLNRSIRCRHLTTGSVMAIPWLGT